MRRHLASLRGSYASDYDFSRVSAGEMLIEDLEEGQEKKVCGKSNKNKQPWLGGSAGWNGFPNTKRLLEIAGSFPIRAHI